MAQYTYNQNGTATLGAWDPAVIQLQQQLNALGANLTVDGKYGPLTQAAQQKYGSQLQNGGQSNGQQNNGQASLSGQGTLAQQIASYMTTNLGMPASFVSQFSPSQLVGVWGPVVQSVVTNYSKGQTNRAISEGTYAQAYQDALNDPGIQQQFGDSIALDKSQLQSTLNGFAVAQNIAQQGNATQFAKDIIANAQNNAQEGIAESGAAGQAKQDIENEQKGVIQSARSQQLQNIYNAGSTLEAKYGTAGLGQFGTIGYGGQVYNPIGGVQGTQPQAYQQAVGAANQKYLNELTPPVATTPLSGS